MSLRPHLVSYLRIGRDTVFTAIFKGGTVKLNSSNPFDFPLIDPAYLTDEVDLNIAAETVAVALSFVSQSPFKGFVLNPYGQLVNATTRSDFEAYVRNESVSFWHPCCTAKMGSASDQTAVVDSQLRLKGAQGVRIIDASIFVSRAFLLCGFTEIICTSPISLLRIHKLLSTSSLSGRLTFSKRHTIYD